MATFAGRDCNERFGEVSTIIHKDTEELEGVVGHFMSIMFSNILIALALGAWLFSKNAWMGLAMVSLPVAGGFTASQPEETRPAATGNRQ